MIKKLFFLLLCFIFIKPSMADVMPQYSTSVNYWGEGVMRLNTVVEIYDKPSETSELIQKIYWDNTGNYNNLKKYPQNEVFVAYLPKNNYAFLTVTDDAEDDWYKVCINQRLGEFGWIKQGKSAKFYPWTKFITEFGTKKGIYLLKDFDDKRLYSKPDKDSQIIDSWKFEKFIQPFFINGNWLIVKLLDFDNQSKTGYIRWRESDGKLLIFAKLKD